MKDKTPHICEILGVAVGQRFLLPAPACTSGPYSVTAQGYVVDQNGADLVSHEVRALQDVINGKASIQLTDLYTHRERAVLLAAQALGFQYIARNAYGSLKLLSAHPTPTAKGWFAQMEADLPDAQDIFPSLLWGQPPLSIDEALS